MKSILEKSFPITNNNYRPSRWSVWSTKRSKFVINTRKRELLQDRDWFPGTKQSPFSVSPSYVAPCPRSGLISLQSALRGGKLHPNRPSFSFNLLRIYVRNIGVSGTRERKYEKRSRGNWSDPLASFLVDCDSIYISFRESGRLSASHTPPASLFFFFFLSFVEISSFSRFFSIEPAHVSSVK